MEFYLHRTPLPPSCYKPGFPDVRKSHVIVIGCLMRELDEFRALPADVQTRHIINVERSIFHHALEVAEERDIPRNWENTSFCNLYNLITYRVQKNLDVKQDTYLIENIISGNIDDTTVGSLKSKELSPLKSKAIIDEIETRRKQRMVKKYSTQYKCPKCRNRKTSVISMQLRSLDEGSTLIITCAMDDCLHEWRLSS